MAYAFRSMLILLVCATVASSDVALARKTSAIVLTEKSAPLVKVYPGEPVEIRLKAQGGTGYSWHPTSSASKVHPLPPLSPSRMRPGGTEVQRFLSKSKRSGTYIVGFAYGQPWKGGSKGAKSRSFTIKVR